MSRDRFSGTPGVFLSYARTLRVWDLESGEELALLTADSHTTSCAVSLDGRMIVAGDAAGNMHILKMEGFGPDQDIRNLRPRNLPDKKKRKTISQITFQIQIIGKLFIHQVTLWFLRRAMRNF